MPATMTQTTISPYLFFGGRCEEALAFYQTALGAQVMVVIRFSESPDPVPEGMLQPGYEQKIMHSAFRIGQTELMASDGCGDAPAPAGFSLSLSVTTQAEAEKAFNALAEGGTIQMPLGPTFWSPCYGMLTDRFGIGWMVNLTAEMVA
jgi:PhnB protein